MIPPCLWPSWTAGSNTLNQSKYCLPSGNFSWAPTCDSDETQPQRLCFSVVEKPIMDRKCDSHVRKDPVTVPVTVAGTHHTGLLKTFSTLFLTVTLLVKATPVYCLCPGHTEEPLLMMGQSTQCSSMVGRKNRDTPQILFSPTSTGPASSSTHPTEVSRGSSAAPVFGAEGSNAKLGCRKDWTLCSQMDRPVQHQYGQVKKYPWLKPSEMGHYTVLTAL